MAADEINPFESPKCDEPGNLDYYSDGESLYVRPHSRLPARCVFTNQRLRSSAIGLRAIPWQGGSFRLVLDNYAQWGIAPEIRRKNLTANLIFILLALLTILFTAIGYFAAGMLGSFASGAVALIFSHVASKKLTRRQLHATGRYNGYFRIEGCGREFLESLPDASGFERKN